MNDDFIFLSKLLNLTNALIFLLKLKHVKNNDKNAFFRDVMNDYS